MIVDIQAGAGTISPGSAPTTAWGFLGAASETVLAVVTQAIGNLPMILRVRAAPGTSLKRNTL